MDSQYGAPSDLPVMHTGSTPPGVLALQELTDAFTEMHSSETWNPQALAERDLYYYYPLFTDCKVH